tara:strand:+ start:19352 stop:19663 length:312 start_codon:yes stop_codon:yes gene_type:complete
MKEELIKYIELKFKYYRFEAVEKIGDIRSKLFFDIVFLFLFFCFLLFVGFTSALILNAVLKSVYLGFVIVTTGLLLIMLIMLWKRKEILDKIFKNYIDRNIPS